MINVTRINGAAFTLNAEMVEFVESTPDTIITMSDGKKIIVRDTVQDVIDKIIEYKQNCFTKLTIERAVRK